MRDLGIQGFRDSGIQGIRVSRVDLRLRPERLRDINEKKMAHQR